MDWLDFTLRDCIAFALGLGTGVLLMCALIPFFEFLGRRMAADLQQQPYGDIPNVERN